MAMAGNKSQCASCGKNKATSICAGCSQNFCSKHFTEHRQQLSAQLDQIEQDRDLFQQTLNQQRVNPQKNSLIEQVDRWEQESIEKIKRTAQEIRQRLSNHTNEHIIQTQLEQLTHQLRESREEDSITEGDLHKWKDELKQLAQQLDTPPNITIQQTGLALVNKIQIQLSGLISIPVISSKAKWVQNGITVAGRNGAGTGIDQLSCPCSFCIDDDGNIYVADYSNRRIVQWKQGTTVGQVVAGGQGAGDRNDQLNGPVNVIVDKKNDCFIICEQESRRVVRWSRQNGTSGETIISNIRCRGVAMDNDGYLYASDYDKHEVRRWKIGQKDGTVVAGGNGQGNRLDQFSTPYQIFVDENQSVYVSDCGNHRVMKWVKGAREGVVVAGGHGHGNALKRLFNPYGIVVDQLGTVYVADQGNHRVVRWLKGATEGSVVVGGNGCGAQANQLSSPWDLSFDPQNNLYVVDCNNNRIQKFNIESD